MGYLDLQFDVELEATVVNVYRDSDRIRFANLGPFARFKKTKSTDSSGKEVENLKMLIVHA